jgi:hypothetical protein
MQSFWHERHGLSEMTTVVHDKTIQQMLQDLTKELEAFDRIIQACITDGALPHLTNVCRLYASKRLALTTMHRKLVHIRTYADWTTRTHIDDTNSTIGQKLERLEMEISAFKAIVTETLERHLTADCETLTPRNPH